MNTAIKILSDPTMNDYLKTWAYLQPDRCIVDGYGIHVFMSDCLHSLGPHDTCYSRALVVAALEEAIAAEKLYTFVSFNPNTGRYFAAIGPYATEKSPVKAQAMLSAFLQCLTAQEQRPC